VSVCSEDLADSGVSSGGVSSGGVSSGGVSSGGVSSGGGGDGGHDSHGGGDGGNGGNASSTSSAATLSCEGWIETRWRAQTLMQWAILYVPPQCKADVSVCSVHVNFHGCIDLEWAHRRAWSNHLSLNEYAQANDIIVLYPQAKGTYEGAGVGCWNWVSYDDDPLFDTRDGYEAGMVASLLSDLQAAVDGATTAAANTTPDEVSKEVLDSKEQEGAEAGTDPEAVAEGATKAAATAELTAA